jgi:hypothetical protein
VLAREEAASLKNNVLLTGRKKHFLLMREIMLNFIN